MTGYSNLASHMSYKVITLSHIIDDIDLVKLVHGDFESEVTAPMAESARLAVALTLHG